MVERQQAELTQVSDEAKNGPAALPSQSGRGPQAHSRSKVEIVQLGQ